MKSSKSLLLLLLSSAAPGIAYAQDVAQAPASAPGQLPDEEEEPSGGAGATEVEAEGEEEAIVITGSRPRGSVEGDIEPELTLDARDIRSFGASNIAELLEQLAPQITSGRGGQPVVLVNGKRVSGPAAYANLPPEAILRTEIFPEELALKYGYRADQRVVNIILRERYRSVTAEVEGGFATAGGRETGQAEVQLTRINRDTQTQLGIEYEHEGSLLESERDILQVASNNPYDLIGNIRSSAPRGAGGIDPEIDPALSALAGQRVTVAGVPTSAADGLPTLGSFVSGANAPNLTDLGEYRTKLPLRNTLTVNGTVSRPIGDVAASVTARYELQDSNSLLGLPSRTLGLPAASPFSPFDTDTNIYRYFDALGPLERDTTSHNGQVGLGLNGDFMPWRWNFTANYERTSRTNLTDRDINIGDIQTRINAGDPSLNPFGNLNSFITPAQRDRSFSVNDVARAELVFSGPLLAIPSGDIRTSVRGGVYRQGTRSETRTRFSETDFEVSQTRANLQANLDVPIASKRDDVLAVLGNLSVNANGEVEQLSGYGTLLTFGGGVNWEPFTPLRLIASFTQEDRAPNTSQLGDPVIVTPNVRTFDFVRGETVDISVIDGGNPDLAQSDSRRISFGATVRPIEDEDLTFQANYNARRTSNLISNLPILTAEIEAAFPERVTRDATGRLVSVDTRPVNFAREDSKEIRWGFNFSKSFGQPVGRGPGQGQGRGAGFVGAGGPPLGTTPGATPPTGAAPSGNAAPGTGSGSGQPNAQGQQAQPGQGGFGRGPGGPGGGRGGFGGGRGGFGGGQRGVARLGLSLYHTWRLQDELLIREGVPVLDRLDGSTTSRFGQPAHLIQLQGRFNKNGFGAFVNANWQSSAFVRGSNNGLTQTSDYFISDRTTIALRVFAELGAQPSLLRDYPWLRGSRVSLNVNNLFDTRLDIRDANGMTPINFLSNPDDPLGRTVTLSLRKLF